MANHEVIRIEHLGKRYRIGEKQRYRTLRDVLVNTVASSSSRLLRNKQKDSSNHILWALQDISFHVNQGEVLGIIGHNGAGKSTLLKILSRITKPTRGCVKIRGRVGSLLEVGTGFHPELTGRENIYLNGAILGMKKAEIDRKFDEIVAFAETEKFLDTPVKHYSSGMYVRLAFAVAAHLEPEILIVDEVLAVGDAAFQKKSIGKMSSVASSGRTVLFVSHNISAIQRLCSRAILLEHGQLAGVGPTEALIRQYLASGGNHLPNSWIDVSKVSRRGNGQARVTALQYSSSAEIFDYQPYSGGPLEVTLRIASDSDREVHSLAAMVYDKYGTKLVNADTVSIGESVALHQGENELQIRIEALHLNPGLYHLGWWLGDAFGKIYDLAESAVDIEVVEKEKTRPGARPKVDGLVDCQFRISKLS